MMEPRAEFDHLAENYEGLLRHPVRDGFVRTNEFYHRRKWMLIAEFFFRSRVATRHSLPGWMSVVEKASY